MRKAYPAGAGSTPAAQEALQAAISLDRLTLVKELLNQPGADVGAIDLVQVRSHRDRTPMQSLRRSQRALQSTIMLMIMLTLVLTAQ